MGCKNSKKLNKDIEKQKMCKVGLGLGRNNIRVEGNFQIGYHSKTDKKYSAVDGESITDCVDGESITDCVDGESDTFQKKISTVLPTIQEETSSELAEENG